MINVEVLKEWFELNKRDLPWRAQSSPYSVWVSEMMLQQTQVSTVIPYFLRWMKRFPSIESLAKASLYEVLKMWEGLGYYSRARSLHEGAKYILVNFKGNLPNDRDRLLQIKGVGPYTVGAILSFAFHQKASAVDGNVIRVLARYFNIEEDMDKLVSVNKLRRLAESLLPEDEHWIVNEALIELGATICQKKARCKECPLQNSCLAYARGNVENLPFKSKKVTITPLYRSVAVVCFEGLYLVKKEDGGKIMSGLYEFPYLEINKEGVSSEEALKRHSKRLGLKLSFEDDLSQVSHSFTRYKVRLDPVLLKCSKRVDVEGYEWKSEVELAKLAFSSGHKRVLAHVLNRQEGGKQFLPRR